MGYESNTLPLSYNADKQQDLNLQQSVPQTEALPLSYIYQKRAAGFEPTINVSKTMALPLGDTLQVRWDLNPKHTT
jgi:hypothetical protein